jgi:prepilin-type N-terminal cleavage/methylation domain-containing protein/prepilin-type processing-associated H-X9-DG protein
MRQETTIMRCEKVSRAPRAAWEKRDSAFTLIELLIVVAIIALLVSILLPSLAAAREISQAAICGSNQHQIVIAGSMYGADYDGWIGPTTESFGNPMYSFNPKLSQPMPSQLLVWGEQYWKDTWQVLTPADLYAGLGYIPFTQIPECRVMSGEDKGPIFTSDVLRCPLALAKLGHLYGVYDGANGRIQSTYFYSCLMRQYANPWWGVNGSRRTNIWGPYRTEELANAADTYLMGDGNAQKANTIYQWYIPPSWSFFNCDHAIQRDVQYAMVGLTWFYFGLAYDTIAVDNDPYYFYHEASGPIAAFWDGHVETTMPNTPADPFFMYKHITANGMPYREDGSTWPLSSPVPY